MMSLPVLPLCVSFPPTPKRPSSPAPPKRRSAPLPPIDLVVPIIAADHVVALKRIDHVSAAKASDDVGIVSSHHGVTVRRPDDREAPATARGLSRGMCGEPDDGCSGKTQEGRPGPRAAGHSGLAPEVPAGVTAQIYTHRTRRRLFVTGSLSERRLSGSPSRHPLRRRARRTCGDGNRRAGIGSTRDPLGAAAVRSEEDGSHL